MEQEKRQTMKIFYSITIILSIILAGCNESQPTVIHNFSINNQSGIELQHIRWNDEYFPGSGTMATIVLPGTGTSKYVKPGSGYIFFEYKNGSGWSEARTTDLVKIEAKEQRQVIFTNNTVIMDIQTNETRTLSEF